MFHDTSSLVDSPEYSELVLSNSASVPLVSTELSSEELPVCANPAFGSNAPHMLPPNIGVWLMGACWELADPQLLFMPTPSPGTPHRPLFCWAANCGVC